MTLRSGPELVERLRQHGYGQAQRLPVAQAPSLLRIAKECVLHPPWSAAHDGPLRLFDPSPFAQRHYARFARESPHAFVLFRLFFLNRHVESDALQGCLGERLVETLQAEGLLRTVGAGLESVVRIVPYRDLFVFTDAWDRSREDFTYLGRDSIEMAEFVSQRLGARRFRRGLDLCTGTGIHALLLARQCERVLGIDINPRAIEYATHNAQVNELPQVEFLRADLTAGVRGTFDVIVSNPPLRLLPVEERQVNRDGFGGALGIELTLKIARLLPDLLADSGLAVIGSVAPVVQDTNTLLQELDRIFSGTPFEVELIHTDLTSSLEHRHLHARHRIRSLLPCYLVVKRSPTFRLTVRNRISYQPIKRLVVAVRQFTIRSS